MNWFLIIFLGILILRAIYNFRKDRSGFLPLIKQTWDYQTRNIPDEYKIGGKNRGHRK